MFLVTHNEIMFFIVFFIIGLVSISFAWWPYTDVAFEVPKVIVFSVFTKILFLIFLYDLFKNPKNGSRWKLDKRIFNLILIFFVWTIFSSLLGSDLPKSIMGNYFRRDGLLTLFDLVGFSLFVSYFWKEKYIRLISATFFSTGLILSYLTLFKLAQGSFILGSAVTFGNPVFLAGYLSVSLPFSYYFLSTFKNKYYYLLLLPQILAIFSIGATSAIISILLYAIIYFLILTKGKLKILYISILTILLLSVLYGWAKDYQETNNKSLIAEGRVRIFLNIAQGIAKRPLTGYGWSNVDSAFETGNWPLKLNNDIYLDKAHSHILEIAATTGIPGLVIYLSLLISIFFKLEKKFKKAENKFWYFTLISIFLLFVFHSQTNVISITEELLFWLIMGIVLIK